MRIALPVLASLSLISISFAGESWPQFQFDAGHSGNAADREIEPENLGLRGTVALTDAIFTAPVISGDGKIYVIDGSGVVFCIDEPSHAVDWKFETKGGHQNVNNVSTPAVSGDFLHVGTTAGFYYVLNRKTGEVVTEIDCGDPIFSAPVVANDRVYFATLGAVIHALEPNGEEVWKWDFVKEVVGFDGNRWSGADWVKFRGDRVNWKDHFVCSRDICVVGKNVVMPAGGRTVFVEDTGDAPKLRATGEIPKYAGSEFPATFGQSADADGNVYVQWHRRDNAGRVEKIQLEGDELQFDFVKGSETSIRLHGLLSFSPVAVRDGTVYRVRPESGVGLASHGGEAEAEVLHESPAIASPVLTKNHAIYGGLDGKVRVVSLAKEEKYEFETGFGTPITAPVAVANGKIFACSEDGHLYVFSPGKKYSKPNEPLNLTEIRSPLTGKLAGPEYDWYTNYGDFAGTNANDQGLKPPLRMRWARRLEGTVKHLPVCGGGRLYTHTAEGQIIAVEQDTGRLLWRKYWPDVYLSFTSPLYIDGKLLVPQAGIKQSRMRCLDAATGELLWETPFTGTPSWSRQFPPVVHDGIAIYASGSGEYAAHGSEKFFTFGGEPEPRKDGREVMSWIYSNDNPYYPKDQKPRIWAWDLETGDLVWDKEFSDEGVGGNDNGICLLDGKLYYSVFFGYATSQKKRRGLPVENNGLTACLDPKTGDVIWKTNDYYVTSKCTLSARDGRIFIGGFNRAQEGTDDRFVWCLDAKTGDLIWKSDPVTSALNVVT
ncbi:MAG: PQQ-binding-like beta-propeller repeat protein, partial [Verrucomicrobiales bacterium]|nr:PQQ-binding-like beta-propeller repeat protein [Verrucomicrobiales bacterium]